MGWYIFLIIILLLIFLLSANITIDIDVDNEKIFIDVRYLFFKKRLIPETEKKKKDNPDKKSSEMNVIKKKKSMEEILEILRAICGVISPIGRAIKYFLSKVKIRKAKFLLIFGMDDAAQTGIYYGQAMAASSQIYNLFDSVFDFKYEEISITPRFGESIVDYHLYSKIMVAPIVLLIVGKKVVVPIIKVLLATKEKEGE